jgi:hypothetical protein
MATLIRLTILGLFIHGAVDAFFPSNFVQLCGNTRSPELAQSDKGLQRVSWIQKACSVHGIGLRTRRYFMDKDSVTLHAIGRGRGTPSDEAWKQAQEVVEERRENPKPASTSKAAIVRAGNSSTSTYSS